MKIGIVGLGLMGGSIAKALNQFHEISAYDINADSIQYALNNNLIHRSFEDIKSFFDNCEIVFLCLYPHSVKNFIITYQKYIKKDTVVIEITGVKSTLIDELDNLISPHYDFVYTHPIAGREKKGVTFASNTIFTNANFVIVPVKRNLNSSLNIVDQLAHQMGFKNITQITKEEHDNIIAYTSQLTHVISLALVNSDKEDFDTSLFIGDSYRDLTRISMINEDLWSELFLSNKEYLLDKINAFEKYLDSYKAAIENDDRDSLKKMMIDSRIKRTKIERKNQS